MPLTKSTILLQEYLYTTLSGYTIDYKSLSYKVLELLQTKYSEKQHQHKILIIKTSLSAIEDFYKLTAKDIDILYTNILNSSYVSNIDMSAIKRAVGIVMEESFKDDTFKNCTLCQERGLDKQRNCPLLHKSTHDPMVFYVIDQEKVKVCPMDDVNSPIVADAFRCHSMFSNGFMPAEGGLYDQTQFFVESSLLVKGVIDKAQAKAMEKK